MNSFGELIASFFFILPVYFLWVEADAICEILTESIQGSFGLHLSYGLFEVPYPYSNYVAVGCSSATQCFGCRFF